MQTTTLTGSYIAIAGMIVAILAYFHISVLQEQVETGIAGVVAIYGLIHQIVVHKKTAGRVG